MKIASWKILKNKLKTIRSLKNESLGDSLLGNLQMVSMVSN